MPSNLPSSFASAAAGQNANRDSRGGRGDGRGASSGDWSRRDGRSANGTLTFRRSSTTPTGHASISHSSTDSAVQLPNLEDSYPVAPAPHELEPSRYTKDELLDMFRPLKPVDDSSRLFVPGWNPMGTNGNNARGWNRSSDGHVPQEPGACWDHNGDSVPLGLQHLSAEEKEAFTAEINSPLKPPTQNKDGHAGTINGRKASVSQGTSGNAFNVNSPASNSRPNTRRRETLESNPISGGGLTSPSIAPGRSREDGNPWLSRRSNDVKESDVDEAEAEQSRREVIGKPVFGSLSRGSISGGSGMSAIWPPSNQATPTAGGFGNFSLPQSSVVGERRVGSSGGSRLAHLIPRDGHGSAAAKLGENQSASGQQSWRSRPRTDTDPFGDDGLSGSAVLGGAQDTSTSGNAPAGRVGVLGTPVKGSTSDFGMSGLNLGTQAGANDPMSPAETNPYRSPAAESHDHEDGDSGGADKSHSATQNEQHSAFGSVARAFGTSAFDGSDRSQTSSVGPKGYALGGLSGWPVPTGASTGTPERDRANFGNAFASSLFSPIGDLQSPGLSGLNNVFGPAAGGVGRGSKLGSLFPPSMQSQMQSHEGEHTLSDSVPDSRQGHTLGAIGRGAISGPARDTGSPMRSSRGVFEELFPSSDSNRAQTGFTSTDGLQSNSTASAPQTFTPVSGGLPFSGANQIGSEPPAAQVRQMVMPDRMRWVYLDPQGQIQGPFTGLEMNDWYKANFFTPDLRVKKVEDPEFEPLGQLIRRIGNSREPFLVPQIGIPHGPPSQSGPFNPASTGGGVVPPLSGVFPSFGKTLTAEEQNNLERRKQEEQYLMAQQREFMMRQQAMSKFQMQGPALQHHSSAQSLQSQPSFGSITSPIGAPSQQPQQQPPPPQAPIGSMPPAGYSDVSVAMQSSLRAASGNVDIFRLDDLAHLTPTERQVLASLRAGPSGNEYGGHQQRVTLAGDVDMRSNLPNTDQLPHDMEGFKERLQEFQDLRALHEAEQASGIKDDMISADSSETMTEAQDATASQMATGLSSKTSKAGKKKQSEDVPLSLTQQVQKAQAAAAAASQSIEPDMPMPFPPPSSSTPLPAPTAQRARSNLPEQYSRSQNGTPDVSQPPPMAPWAKEPGQEGQKGPSLKEIQEAEARKAAKAEEAAAALRKAAMEQEAALLREKEKLVMAATAAGLPPSSTWGHGSPVSAASPWVKPGPVKGPVVGSVPTASTMSKKTLAEIQREEEVRKQKAKDISVQTGAPPMASKSYANLAGKPNQASMPTASSPAAVVGSGWATVGAGGKVKIPTGPAAQSRATSVTSANATKPSGPLQKPAMKLSAIGNANGRNDGINAAMEEFSKWTRRELSRGLTNVTDISEFQADLDVLPLDTGVIADAVYINSKTMDGRHFAEEYVRRKKLAEKGIVEKQPLADHTASSGAGGWSEVAKRSGSNLGKEGESSTMQGAGFKVVPSRKKGKK
ncbi:hypothetical protein CDD82_3027 [Ophiocordyceps australis]|uniref:GYF domain-containing protein n=1 Tax=Ophiocordyceps australis TaxID=1399860 RepID=A0A2C5ZGB3_9HYPO|nr:hypothetical protein CDD82_3027 [Ophiocordyceps australis]